MFTANWKLHALISIQLYVDYWVNRSLHINTLDHGVQFFKHRTVVYCRADIYLETYLNYSVAYMGLYWNRYQSLSTCCKINKKCKPLLIMLRNPFVLILWINVYRCSEDSVFPVFRWFVVCHFWWTTTDCSPDNSTTSLVHQE